MSERLETVEHAAQRLQVHPKTVLRFIRDGRLRATRIGKAWRILPSDLDAFAGAPVAGDIASRSARAMVIVDLEDVPMETSRRLASALQAMVSGDQVRPRPIKLDTVYDPERLHLKVVIVACASDAAPLLQGLHTFWEMFR